MSIHSDLLERYQAARTKFNTINEQQETLYHKRQRIILENSRTNSYKHKLIQSKRREWSSFRRNISYHSSHHPFRLSTNIRDLFQVSEKKQSSSHISPPIMIDKLPPRIYPTTWNLRQITSNQCMNINILQQTHFLGQFDKKFLISKHSIRSSDINRVQLIIFDQHAISERILLERLLTYFKNENIHSVPFHLSTSIVVARNPRFLYTYDQISLLERTGFILSSISTQNLVIRAVPGWLLSLGQRQFSTSLSDNIIRDIIDKILLTANTYSINIELIMYETLKSLACHNAIKFNDPLSNNECHHLLNELKSCSMPFICAHGRTSAAILWEYDTMSDKYQVDMTELEKLASIHKWLKES